MITQTLPHVSNAPPTSTALRLSLLADVVARSLFAAALVRGAFRDRGEWDQLLPIEQSYFRSRAEQVIAGLDELVGGRARSRTIARVVDYVADRHAPYVDAFTREILRDGIVATFEEFPHQLQCAWREDQAAGRKAGQ